MKLPSLSLRKIFRRHRKLSTQNPYKDWQRIVIVFSVLLIGVLAGAVALFWGIDTGTIFQPSISSESARPTLDRSAITKLSGYYEQRAQKVQALTSSSTLVVDPSI